MTRFILKNIKSFSKLLFVLICTSSFLAACTFQTQHRGYIFPENLEMQVQDIKTTAQLEEEIGSPQAKTVYGEEVWIYYSVDENYRGPLSETYTNKKVLLVWVNASGRVLKTKVLTDKDLQNVMIAEGETAIPAAIELNALEELFNNVGRFSPAGLGQ